MTTQQQTINTGTLETSNFMLSRNPDKAMQEMMEAIDELRAIYREENEALAACDTKKFVTLQDRKMKTARDCGAGMQQMIARKDEFKTSAPSLRQRLNASYDDFLDLTSVNLNALDRVRRSVTRLQGRIMTATRDAVRNDSPNYSAAGSLNQINRAVSISVNESV